MRERCFFRVFLFAGFSSSFLWFPAVGMGFTFSVTGSVSADKNSVNLTVVIDQLSAEEFVSGNQEKQKAQLTIFLQGSSKAILAGVDDASTDREDDFYWDLNDIIEEDSGTRYRLSYDISVYNNSNAEEPQTISGLLESNSNIIQVKPGFQAENAETSVTSDSNFPVQQIFRVPNAAPAGLIVKGAHKGISVSWTGNSKVEYTKNDDQSDYEQIPENALVMLFLPNESNLQLKAFTIDNASGNHQETTCTFTNSTGNGCISCADNVFVGADQEVGGINFRLVSNRTSQPETVFSDLEVGQEYIVVVQYQSGAQRSSCSAVFPIQTVSLTERNGEDEGQAGDPRCFIVSATFGHDMVKKLELFRWFRDRFLLPYSWGRRLTKFYYNNSQGLADRIKHSEPLKGAFRFLLLPVSWLLEALKFLLNHGWVVWMLLIINVFYLVVRLVPWKSYR